jgi:CRP/FNR family transcriptional regulator, anaerobic regulatory protein
LNVKTWLSRKSAAVCEPIGCEVCGVHALCSPFGVETDKDAALGVIVKRRQVLKRGEVLYRMGEPFKAVYAIRSGSAKTYVSTDDGRVQITGFHVAGELLGLNAMSSGIYSSEARALETISICEVAVEKLDELSQRVPELQRSMIRIMSDEIEHHQELMLLLGKKTADERIATYLLSLSRRFAKRHYSATEFNLSMSRSDIGNYLGIAEETVCRILSRFEDQGLVTIRHRHVVLNDLERLEHLAHDRRIHLQRLACARDCGIGSDSIT